VLNNLFGNFKKLISKIQEKRAKTARTCDIGKFGPLQAK